MKLLPHYKEEKALKPNSAISIIENSNVLSPEDAMSISSYMRSCVIVDEWLSPNPDPLNENKLIAENTWSDGVYVWHESHIYYIEQYRVRLPQNFYSHVNKQLEGGFDPTALDKNDLQEKFEKIADLQVEGNESVYDLSY